MYSLSKGIDSNKIFIVQRSELEGRFDPKFIEPQRILFLNKLRGSKNIIKLKELIKEGAYGILPPGDSYDDVHPIKFIRATELKEDLKIDFEDVHFVREEYYTKRAAIKKDDILLAVKGATIASNKCVSIVTENPDRAIINGSIFRMQINDKALPLYVAYMLNTDLLKKQMKYNLVANNAVDYLDKSLIYNLYIPLPSLKIQTEIVKKFRAAYLKKEESTTQADNLLSSIDDYLLEQLGIKLKDRDSSLENRIFKVRRSIIDERFDPIYYHSDLTKFNNGRFDSVSIASIALQFKSGFGAGKQDQASEEKGVIQIRPTNIDENGFLKYDRNIYLPLELQGIADTIEVGDILFNNTNSQDLVGKTSILEDDRELFYSNHITKIKVNQDLIIPKYLWAILNLYQRNRVFYSICTNWNNQSGIGTELLRSVKVPLPPVSLQKQIVSHIETICSHSLKLKKQADNILEQTKKEVEKLILE